MGGKKKKKKTVHDALQCSKMSVCYGYIRGALKMLNLKMQLSYQRGFYHANCQTTKTQPAV